MKAVYFSWRQEKYQKNRAPQLGHAAGVATLARTVLSAAGRNSPAFVGLKQPARFLPKKPPALGCAATGGEAVMNARPLWTPGRCGVTKEDVMPDPDPGSSAADHQRVPRAKRQLARVCFKHHCEERSDEAILTNNTSFSIPAYPCTFPGGKKSTKRTAPRSLAFDGAWESDTNDILIDDY
ncbi:MAG: hypothetical protein ACOZBW_08560 [Thermodesulfobacteriota bacterium]